MSLIWIAWVWVRARLVNMGYVIGPHCGRAHHVSACMYSVGEVDLARACGSLGANHAWEGWDVLLSSVICIRLSYFPSREGVEGNYRYVDFSSA